MKVLSIAVMALLGRQVSAIALRDIEDDLMAARGMVDQVENYAEIQERNKEVKEAWKELELKQLQVDTKKSLASIDDFKLKELEADSKYEKVYGFKPNRFEIVNDVQLKDDLNLSARDEVMAAQRDADMSEAAALVQKNQKKLEETLHDIADSESKAKKIEVQSGEELEVKRAKADAAYTKKFGFEASHFIIVNDNDLVQIKDE